MSRAPSLRGGHHKAIPVTTEQLEQLAFESGRTIEVRADKMMLAFPSGRRFIAPLPIPEQREAGEGS